MKFTGRPDGDFTSRTPRLVRMETPSGSATIPEKTLAMLRLMRLQHDVERGLKFPLHPGAAAIRLVLGPTIRNRARWQPFVEEILRTGVPPPSPPPPYPRVRSSEPSR